MNEPRDTLHLFPEESYDLGLMKASFTQCVLDINPDASPESIDLVFQDFTTRYSEPHRHFHALPHIGQMLSLAEKHKDRIQDYNAIVFSIWGHDSVWEIGGKLNEEKSVEHRIPQYRSLGIPEPMLDKVGNYILATKRHAHEGDDHDLDLFLDMDMSILGAPRAKYMKYAGQIRKEYTENYDVERFIMGRHNFLRIVLERSIFHSEEFQPLEEIAHENLKAELDELAHFLQ